VGVVRFARLLRDRFGPSRKRRPGRERLSRPSSSAAICLAAAPAGGSTGWRRRACCASSAAGGEGTVSSSRPL